jgi:hypothetical protein
VSASRSWMTLATPLAVVFALGCEEPPPAVQSYPLIVRAASEDGDPLAGVPIVVNATVLGVTDGEGVLMLQMQGQEGLDVSFAPKCPAGSRPIGAPPSLKLRTLSGAARPEVEVTCGRDKRTAALLVSAPGFADLPVLVHDREVGRTDATGTAHLLLQGDPSTPLRVVLDTHSLPNVVPPSPHRDLQIGTRDDIVVFAPELAEAKKPEKKQKKQRVKKPEPVKIFRPEKLR